MNTLRMDGYPVRDKGGKLIWQGLKVNVELNHRHFDVFEFPGDLAGDTDAFIHLVSIPISFGYDSDGDIDHFSIPLEPLVPDIVFRRVEPLEDAQLRAWVGTYDMANRNFTVACDREQQLTIAIGDRPPERLLPYRRAKFIVEHSFRHRIEFRADSAGPMFHVILHSPEGIFVAKRRIEETDRGL
jgi:hypothetical protein